MARAYHFVWPDIKLIHYSSNNHEEMYVRHVKEVNQIDYQILTIIYL